MIPELDIWRAAQVMVKHYGNSATTEADMRANEFSEQGNMDGRRPAQSPCIDWCPLRDSNPDDRSPGV